MVETFRQGELGRHGLLLLVKWFKELGIETVPLVGGEIASLGELYYEPASKA